MTKKSLATSLWRKRFKEIDPEGYSKYRLEEQRKYRSSHPQIKEKQKEYSKKYYSEKPEKHKDYRRAIKLETIAAYGGKCQCIGCNESRWEFLTIDHIDKTGSKERSKLGNRGGYVFYLSLKKRNWPKDNYRLLCFNCNCSIGFFGYCPHQLEQNLSKGITMATRKQTSFDGQNSDDMGAKNQLVTMSENMKDPYLAKGSDFPVKAVDAATGQSGSHGTASGGDMLASQSDNQCSPGDAERPYRGSGSEKFDFGDNVARIAANFPISTSKGESESSPVSPSVPETIDFTTGKISVSGVKVTRVGEVEDKNVHIGK